MMTARARKGNLKLRAAQRIRPILIALLVGLVILIAVYMIIQVIRQPRTKAEKREIVEQKIDVRENVRFFQFKGDQGRIEIKGDRNFAVNDTTYRLEGHIVIIDRGRKGGREIRMTGDALVYDGEMNVFALKGAVKVQYNDIIMEGSDFSFDRRSNIMTTKSGLSLTSPNFSGTSQKAVFSGNDEKLVMEDGLRISVRLRLQTSDPLVVTGDRFTFGFRARQGNIEGNVVMAHGRSRGTAGRVYLEQFTDTDDLRLLQLEGGVGLDLEENRTRTAVARRDAPSGAETRESTLGQELSLNRSVRQRLEADAIKIQAYLNLPLVHVVESHGRASIMFFFESGETTAISGEAVDMSFQKDGSLKDLKASFPARLVSRDNRQKILRMIEGESMVLEAETNIMRVTGGQNQRGRIASGRNEFSGRAITILIKLDDFEVRGDAHMTFYPTQQEAGTRGFFSPERPVFAFAGNLRYSSDGKRFSLWNQVRALQENKVLTAEDVQIAEDTGDIACSGRVASVFPHKPKNSAKEEQVRIAADKMRYDRESNQVVYEDHGSMKTRDAEVGADWITVTSDPTTGDVRWIRASKSLTVVMNTKAATGEEAVYDVEQETITITGRPVLKDKEKGTVRGDKLTFYLADGRIHVETRDPIRSETVIKS
jgi:lipopolysaccharide transport protein LptA